MIIIYRRAVPHCSRFLPPCMKVPKCHAGGKSVLNAMRSVQRLTPVGRAELLTIEDVRAITVLTGLPFSSDMGMEACKLAALAADGEAHKAA